ncbi:MAG: 30S ribosomal protein S9 [Fimbriimonadaceae bacterium]|nr:30S ribosomal protein S9 [Fimbriimonadaceae bacterium]
MEQAGKVALKDVVADCHGGATYYGTGHRKTAVARVWIVDGGQGRIFVNGRTLDEYCPVPSWQAGISNPFRLTKTLGQFDIWATANGGGVHSQIEAVRHGLAKALVHFEAELRTPLRRTGFLTRDPRVKERKKFGRKRARRGFQFSKR